MPELPEIETIKLQLEEKLTGERISAIETLHKKSVQGDTRQVIGKKIIGVRRLGKMLVINLENDLHLAIHFKMSGQLVLVSSDKKPASRQGGQATRIKNREKIRIVGGHPSGDWTGKLPSKHTRAIFKLQSGAKMYFNDQRIFGWVRVVSSLQLAEDSFVKNLGPEPWNITDDQFYELIRKRKKAIKLVIMDQTVISGIGNIYANDGLWEARIHPGRNAQSLASQEAKLLRASLIKVLREGIRYGGATTSDAKYINLDGLGGHYQEHFRTYDREGKKCLRSDGGVIKKITLGSRGTYFCPKCQIRDK